MNSKRLSIAKEFCENKKYVILNDFLFHMRMNYDVLMTNSDAVNTLLSLGYNRKRIAFDTYDGGKQSRNEFIHPSIENQQKPIVGRMLTQENALRALSIKILKYLRIELINDRIPRSGLINFNLFNSSGEGLVLLFDNASLKQVLEDIMHEFNYKQNAVVQLAATIRRMSQMSYVRENRYSGNTRNAVDKKFYKYLYDEKDEN